MKMSTSQIQAVIQGVTLKNFEEFTNPPQVLQYDAGMPFQYYRKFLTDDILDVIVEETNRNANSQVTGIGTRSSSRMNMWKDTDRQEIMEFLAIVMYMGMVKYPAITDYWKPSTLFKNAFVPQVMARNRFQILLKFIHFPDNAQSSETVSKTYKVDKVLQELILAFKQNIPACQKLVIDESMIPFRGRLGFRQYLPGKAHKYGTKVFKLADTTGYIYNLKLYTGKSDTTTGFSLATNICLQLMEGYFGQNRTLTVDNYYTSIELGNALLNRKTHLQGTLRKNRRGIPKLTKKLKKGECITFEKAGMVVGYWRDKREVRFLSTASNGTLVPSGSKSRRTRQDILKPNVILEYNKCKQGIDLADQVASYFSPLRKTIRWFHKVAFDVLLNTAVINAYILHNENNPKMQISDFRQSIILFMSGKDSASIARSPPQGKHFLITSTEATKDGRRKRHRCGMCYSELKTTN